MYISHVLEERESYTCELYITHFVFFSLFHIGKQILKTFIKKGKITENVLF